MKLLFWSFVILAAIWLLMKKKLGGGNDLTAHLEEQNALQSIGNTAVDANRTGTGNWPLMELGATPLSGINIDPLNPNNPFVVPFNPVFWQGEATNNTAAPFIF